MDEQNNNSSGSSNYDAYMTRNASMLSDGALQIRLETTRLLRQIEMYLKGKTELWSTDKEGNDVRVEVEIGEPLANKVGVQSIMSFLEILLSPASVQGNFLNEDEFNDFMCNTRKEFAADLKTNSTRFGIENYNFNGIVSRIMSGVHRVMSRAIGNKEREALTQGIKVVESNVVKDNQSGRAKLWPF